MEAETEKRNKEIGVFGWGYVLKDALVGTMLQYSVSVFYIL